MYYVLVPVMAWGRILHHLRHGAPKKDKKAAIELCAKFPGGIVVDDQRRIVYGQALRKMRGVDSVKQHGGKSSKEGGEVTHRTSSR